jgi:hypothetical protein
VAGCSRWRPENTAGHSPQRKIKRNIKTLQNPKAELLTSGWWLEDLETFLGITGNPQKKRNKVWTPEARKHNKKSKDTAKIWSSRGRRSPGPGRLELTLDTPTQQNRLAYFNPGLAGFPNPA